MFVTKARLEQVTEYHERELKRVERKLWDLQYKHDRLLAHLGLIEHREPEKILLRSKGGPELSDA